MQEKLKLEVEFKRTDPTDPYCGVLRQRMAHLESQIASMKAKAEAEKPKKKPKKKSETTNKYGKGL